jgi:hypothetical protein
MQTAKFMRPQWLRRGLLETIAKIKPHGENNKVVKSKPISSWIKRWRLETFFVCGTAAMPLGYGEQEIGNDLRSRRANSFLCSCSAACFPDSNGNWNKTLLLVRWKGCSQQQQQQSVFLLFVCVCRRLFTVGALSGAVLCLSRLNFIVCATLFPTGVLFTIPCIVFFCSKMELYYCSGSMRQQFCDIFKQHK